MPPRLSRTITITTCLLAIPPALYLVSTYRALRPSFPHPIHASRTISPSLAGSRTVNAIVNATGHAIGGDVHSVVITTDQLPPGKDGKVMGDREVLDRLVTGFFGGWVFTPERWALRAWRAVGGGSLVSVACVEAEAEKVGRELWTAGEVREMEQEGWEVGERVGGTFQVVDLRVDGGVGKGGLELEKGGEMESHIDFVFGSDEGRLKGAHRLTVLRRREEGEGGKEVCELRLAGVACNPKAKRPLPSWMLGFHMVYSKLLFREAVAQVLASQPRR